MINRILPIVSAILFSTLVVSGLSIQSHVEPSSATGAATAVPLGPLMPIGSTSS